MKEQFKEAEVELIEFSTGDVIATSTTDGGAGSGTDNGGD